MSRITQEQYRFWKHDNGTIYIVWNERVELTSGHFHTQTRRVSTGATDWRAAEQFRAQFIAGLDNPPPPPEPTLAYLLDRYKKEHGVNTRSLKTIEHHTRTLKKFFGGLQPDHISNALLLKYAKERGVSDGTILRELGTLKAALHFAEGNRWISQQPRFKMPVHQPPPRDLWLKREQVSQLLSKVKSHHMRLFIQIAISTAARSGAILDLTWPQIDFESRLMDFGRGWGNKRRAVVPMNDEVYESLKLAKELAQSDYVIEYHGRPVASVKAGFRRLCQDCGITASPHVLRHTAATWLIMDGVPLSEVARLLGDSEKTVEKVYGKHAPDYLRRAVSALNLKRRLDILSP
ncbi:MAG: site-specific integrase [Alphaproteobacteria bacterium]|jgi:integrase|nr:site-specific integrase [Alphaproteobacteria bacterium]